MTTRTSKNAKVNISFECPSQLLLTLMEKFMFVAPGFESAEPKKSTKKKPSANTAGASLKFACPACQFCSILSKILFKCTFEVPPGRPVGSHKK